MSTILDTIVVAKQAEVAARRERRSLAELERLAAELPPTRGFAANLSARAADGPAVIAEIKRGSPSLGCIRPEMDAVAQARAYESGGASALSVLTDQEFFFARNEDFAEIRSAVGLPMLRKDFVIDAYQLAEARAMGADCVLLIMAILGNREAGELARRAHELGLDVLAETHTGEEIGRALEHVEFDLLGINNRNLKTFSTREETTLELAELVPDRDRLVAESGLHHPQSVDRLWRSGIKRFLVGEAFVKSADPRDTVRAFVNAHRSQ